jgi:hypothetical protein
LVVLDFDVSAVVPEARQTVRRAAEIYRRHTRPWFVGLLVHGSALKGGFIPRCSDIDLELFLAAEAFDAAGQLPLGVSVALHRELAAVDPSPFQYIQCYAVPDRPRSAGWKGSLGPIPGAYHMLAGTLPVPEATAEEVGAAVRRKLAAVRADPFGLPRTLLQHGGGKLERAVRLLCTDVWPALYNVVAYRSADPLAVWGWPKERVLAELEPESALGAAIRHFHERVWAYYATASSVDRALAVIEAGVAFLGEVERWYASLARR